MSGLVLRYIKAWPFVALGAGALVGAAIDTVQYLREVDHVLGWVHIQQYGVSKGERWFVLMFLVWFVLMSLLAVPAWIALHCHQLRGWPIAVLLGALLTFTLQLYITTGFGLSHKDAQFGFSAWEQGGPTYVDNVVTPHGWAIGLKSSAELGIEGAIVGFVVWRVAYRRSSAG